jgi:DNA-binding MarR family transcriptional regulator
MNHSLLYDYLERISNLLRGDTRKSGTTKGLQPVQLEALHFLANCNEYSNTPASVAEFLGLTKGTVSQTLGVLETAGYLYKQQDAQDRRVVHLHLTEAGQELVQTSIPPKLFNEAMQLVDGKQAETVTVALREILGALQKANQSKSFGVCYSCHHHRQEVEERYRCGLTGHELAPVQIHKLCREHQPIAAR